MSCESHDIVVGLPSEIYDRIFYAKLSKIGEIVASLFTSRKTQRLEIAPKYRFKYFHLEPYILDIDKIRGPSRSREIGSATSIYAEIL